MAVSIKSEREIQLMREAGRILAMVHQELGKQIRPGMSTLDVDRIGEEMIRSYGCEPSFKGYCGYPASLCISVNDVVVHGIPGKLELKEGDVVSVDCGVICNGWVGDSAYSFALNGVSEEVKQLLQVTKQSLYLGIEKCRIGQRIGDLSNQIQTYCESFGYGVVRELCGHGLGRKMHEEPSVANYGRKGTGPKFREGMVIAIEPMITLGNKEVRFEADQWTCRTVDGSTAAHFEHDVAITKDGAEILSSFEMIEQAIKTNINLEQI